MMKYARFRIAVLLAAVAGLALFAPHADAQVYNRFGPSNGIMKGDTTTYQTTAATGSDVTALFSGTCNASAFLRGDGSCFALFAGANTWTATQTFGSNGSNLTWSGNDPRALISESDGGVDTKNWLVRAVANQFAVSLATDAAPFSAVSDAFVISRTGTTPNVMNINGTLQNGGNLVPNVASSPTWTGSHQWNGVSTWTQNMNLSKADPRFCQYDSGSDATFFWRMSSDVLRLNIVDGVTCTTTGASAPFAITSAAGTVSALGLTSTALTWNGLDMVNTGSAPTWTGQHIFSSSSGAINLSSVNPALQWNESDQGVDEKLWNLIASSGSLQFQTRTDAGGAGATPFSMSRAGTGTVVNAIGLTGTAITLTGSSANVTVGASGISAIAGLTESSGQFLNTNANPSYYTNETDAAVDNRLWRMNPAAGVLGFSTRNDANNSGVNWLTVARSGTSVGVIGFPSSSGLTVGAPTGGAQGNGTINATGLFVNGVAVGVGSGDAVLSANQTFTGRNIFTLSSTGTNGDGAVATAAARPTFSARETDAAADNRTWLWGADGEQFLLQTINDANTVVGTALQIDRTGTNVDTFTVSTSGTARLAIESDGSFNIGGGNGTSGQVLTSNGAASSPTWQTPAAAAGSGASATAGGSTAIVAAGTEIAVALSTEEFDTGSFHDTVTNNSRVILPSSTGYASCTAQVSGFTGNSVANTVGEVRLFLRKNGTVYIGSSSETFFEDASGGSSWNFKFNVAAAMIPANGTDYVEMTVATNGGFSTSSTVVANSNNTAAMTRLTCSRI